MPKQRYTTEEIIHKLREADVMIGQGRSGTVRLDSLSQRNSGSRPRASTVLRISSSSLLSCHQPPTAVTE